LHVCCFVNIIACTCCRICLVPMPSRPSAGAVLPVVDADDAVLE
jgi:hypothetical protein